MNFTNGNRFTGLGVALVTPFNENGNVHTDALARLTDYLVQGGVDFLVPLGTTGESATLTSLEAEQVLTTVLEANNGRVPVVVGCGGYDTAAVANTMQTYAQKFTIDGFLSVTPYYNRPSQNGLYAHYKTLSQATDLPIILYNVPGRTACNMLPETVLRLAWDCKTIVAIKEASGNLEQGMEIMINKPEDFTVLCGDDALALPAMVCGYHGVISVIGNAFPAPFGRMVRACLSADYTEGRRIHFELLKVMQLNFKEGNPTGIKGLMEIMGLCNRRVRLPLQEASDALLEQYRHLVQ